MSFNAKERFEGKVERVTESGCWIWLGGVTGSGYGALGVDNKVKSTHRVSWNLYHGEIPEGLCVLHTCDTKLCVNPSHLFLGTNKDNTADMLKKGRGPSLAQRAHSNRKRGAAHPSVIKPECLKRGVEHHSAKIKESDVLDIRNSKETGVYLARVYGLSTVTVSRIRRRMIWRHVL